MPITGLYVEGRIDKEVLVAVMRGRLAIDRGGSKGDLPHIVRRERGRLNAVLTCYLRDRDFDYEPVPLDRREAPMTVQTRGGAIHGYIWVRHSIENYLLDPQIAQQAVGIEPAEWEAELENAASLLHAYEAGRWAIAQMRNNILRPSWLTTRPRGVRGEYALPIGVGEADTWNWLRTSTSEFSARTSTEVAEPRVREYFDRYLRELPIRPFGDVLLWYSGKDLLAALSSYLASRRLPQPDDYVQRVVRWIQRNPTQPPIIFPEWQALITSLTT